MRRLAQLVPGTQRHPHYYKNSRLNNQNFGSSLFPTHSKVIHYKATGICHLLPSLQTFLQQFFLLVIHKFLSLTDHYILYNRNLFHYSKPYEYSRPGLCSKCYRMMCVSGLLARLAEKTWLLQDGVFRFGQLFHFLQLACSLLLSLDSVHIN